jgi:hypothetical protein
MYVDADFTGTWHKEFSHLRDSVLSLTGYIIIYNGFPIQWGSKLQSEIALSTTEAEYIALSTTTRELLPLHGILQELSTNSPFASTTAHSKLPPSKIYEDNASCIIVTHRDTQHCPRTKHISLKYHHLRDHINNGTIAIEKVASSSNCTDILGVDKYCFMMMASGCMHTHCMLITFLMERGACMHPLVIIM